MAFDPVLTIGSLFIAIFGSAAGFGISAYRLSRQPAFLGGALAGLAISGMHFTGMVAYRVIGFVIWDQTLITWAVGLAVLCSASALGFANWTKVKAHKPLTIVFFILGIISLHFTAMTAFKVIPMSQSASGADTAAFQAMALSIALIALLVIGAGLSSYLIDATSRHASDEHIRHLALHDFLTGLPNRMSFNNHVDDRLIVAGRNGSRFAVIGIDLNGFKEINDIWGHAEGDKTLQHFAHHLKRAEISGAYVARIGGDEFAALKLFDTDAELTRFIARLEKNLAEPPMNDVCKVVTASIGIALFPRDGETREALVNNADLAMYRAKSDPSHRLQFYDPAMGDAIRSRRLMADDLRSAIENGELTIHYQAQTSIQTGQIIGYEALCRWHNPAHGNVSPSDFIPLAEETGLILPLGKWVLSQSCREAASWQQPYKIAVNLSAVQFSQTDLPTTIHEILLETGLAPSRLELELTETAVLLDRTRSLHLIRQIKALGVTIALDDFGTGYSSLSTLNTFPFDKIKLDRSFIDKVGQDIQSLGIVRAVMALGKSLGVPVLAEGIETEEQLALLRAESCDEAQGFLLGRPIPASQLGATTAPVLSEITQVLPASRRAS